MTPNKKLVETYMEGFRRTDRQQILDCLTDDVEWEIPGMFRARGKDEFAGHIVGTFLHLAFVDIFEIQDGRIHRLASYLIEIPSPAGHPESTSKSSGRR